MSLLLICLWPVLTEAFAQQGQDYFFHSSGQEPRYLAFQQASLQQNSHKLPRFYSGQSNGAFDAFPTLSSQRTLQNEYDPIKPLQFQLTPNQISSLQHFENVQSRPTQFVHTNQHIPQSFQNFQDPTNSESLPFGETLGQSIRFQNLPPAQKPKYSYQLQDAFVDLHNSENDNGRTTQSYANIQHSEGAVNQHSTTSRNRWKQIQSFTSPPEFFDSRRFKRPKVSPSNLNVKEEDVNLKTFVNLNLPSEDVQKKASVYSSLGDSSQSHERKLGYQSIEKNILNKIQPVSGDLGPITKARKTPEFPRGTPAIPKTTIKPEYSTVSNFKITTLRSKNVNFRLSPTTYAPSRSEFGKQNQKFIYNNNYSNNNNFSASRKPTKDTIDFGRHSSELSRSGLKLNNNTLSVSRNTMKSLPDNLGPNYKYGDSYNNRETHEKLEDDNIEYEYSSEMLDDVSQLDNSYEDEKYMPIPQKNNKDNDGNANIHLTETVKNGSFDVLTMNHDHILVSDENFRGFVDSASIDVSEQPLIELTLKPHSIAISNKSLSDGSPLSPNKEIRTIVNESMTEYKTNASSTENPIHSEHNQMNAPPSSDSNSNEGEHPTESWVIIASVQTSRSVSGARFLQSGFKQQDPPKSSISKDSKNNSLGISVPEKISINSSNVTQKNESVMQSATSTHQPISVIDDEYQTSRSSPVQSTESIIDKLDRVQSELSSGILSGRFSPNGNKLHLEDLPDMKTEKSIIASTMKSISSTLSATSPLVPTIPSPVVIRKFTPLSRTTTHRPKITPKPTVTKKLPIFDNIQFDDLTGLLPPGFKTRSSFIPNKNIPSSTTAKSMSEMQGDEPINFNNTSGDSNLMSSQSSSQKQETKYEATTHTTPSNKVQKLKGLESILSNIKFQDVSALLPPGFKQNKTSEVKDEQKELKVPNIKTELPSNLLPPGYKPISEIQMNDSGKSVFNRSEENVQLTSIFEKVLKKGMAHEMSSSLPPVFKLNITSNIQSSVNGTNSTSNSGLKVVFPSRPGGNRKTPSKDLRVKPGGGIGPLQPKIVKGWPTRATTEFTGWPTVSTTPISIEKILAAAKAASEKGVSDSTTTTSTTTTSTTTSTTTLAPTTPGVCSEDCDLAATIKLVGGAKWIPELLDHNTQEWQTLANQVHDQLESVYSSSESLSRWYKRITIDAFSEGSVLVDYFVELTDLGRTVNTADMRRLFHQSLQEATVAQEAMSGGDTLTATNATQYKMGTFVVDPQYTDFVVLPKNVMATVGMVEDDVLLPQWAIAVIVIGLASLLFVIIFGVTVLVNRHNSAKKKQPIALTEDMLNELNKNHMGGIDNYGIDDLYNMEDVWNEKHTKKRSTGSFHENNMGNLYDSWRSEWNGYYNPYSGGVQSGGGSSTSGYSRRKPDYDTNF